MTRVWKILPLAILVSCFASPLSSAAGPPPAELTAGAQCSILFRHFARALPRESRREDAIDSATKALLSLKALVSADQVGLASASPKRKKPIAVLPTKDGGHLLHFHSGARPSEPGASDAEDYRKLQARIDQLVNLLEHNPERVSVFSTDDLGQIRDLLETKKRMRDELARRKERGFRCFLITAPLGILAYGALGVHIAGEDMQSIVDKVRSEPIATTRERHLELLRAALYGDPEASQKLEKHVAYLDLRKKLGLAVPYGARESDYRALAAREITYEQMNDLALEEPVTSATLLAEVASGQPHYFSAEQVGSTQRQRTAVPGLAFMFGSVGGLGLAVTVSGFCRNEKVLELTGNARLQMNRVASLGGPKELKPLRDVVRNALKRHPFDPKAPRQEVMWLGANAADGDHRDLFLIVDKAHSPPSMQLVGLSYKAPTGYMKPPVISEIPPPPVAEAPPPPPKAPPPPSPLPVKAIELSALERKLNAKFFAGLPRERARGVAKLFEQARGLELDPAELAAFKGAVEAYHGPEDLRLLRFALDDIRRKRTAGSH